MTFAVSGHVLTFLGFAGWVAVVYLMGETGARRAKRKDAEKWRRVAEGMRERRMR